MKSPHPDTSEDFAIVVSVINEQGVDFGDETLHFSKKQITDFCKQKTNGLKILDEHNRDLRIGETIKLFEFGGLFWSELKIRDKESIKKLLDGQYVGCSIGMDALERTGPNAKIVAKAIHEISLTENPDRRDAQIVRIMYKDKIYSRKWDDETNFVAFSKDNKALYGKKKITPFLLFFFFCFSFFPPPKMRSLRSCTGSNEKNLIQDVI